MCKLCRSLELNWKDSLICVLGSAFLAFGLYNVHALSGVTEGGVLGLTLLLDRWFSISPSVSGAILNVLCYGLGWKLLGKRFLAYSFLSTVSFSLSYKLYEQFPPLWPEIANYPLLAAFVGAVLVGVGAAVYLTEYAQNKKLVAAIEYAAETLSGIPSIVYGLFGMLFFVTRLHWGYSLLAGAMTLAIMILPLIMRTAEEALIAVPDSYREGSFGLGAGRLRTVFRIVLPAAGPGILSGVILGIGRIVGETAALIFTAGTMAQIPGLFQSGRTLAIHMYVLSGEALHMNEANATAVVLLLVVLLMNTLSALAAKKLTKK